MMAGAGKREPGLTAEIAGRLGPTVSVVIPAKNEALNLPDVFAGLPADLYEVILVDGYSSDDTVSVAQRLRPGITIVGQSRKGKGNALACGFAVATGDFIVMLDADGSTDPSEIPRFVEALMSGADFAKGSRFMPGGGSADISRIRRIGNFWLNWIVNVLYGTRYTDMCYGYNAFRRECLDVMRLQAGDTAHDEADTEFQPNLGPDRRDVDIGDETAMVWGDGFEVETLINVRIAKAGLRVVEVPSFERCRNFGTSNLNAFSDGMRVFRTIRAEWKRGTRKDTIASAEAPREVGASWSVLSTLTEEAS
jgi:glycosyltransferase involved in cell wall biosynthesis